MELQIDVSIHAPAGGATANSFFYLQFHCFNPRARGGRDGEEELEGEEELVSIHAPAGGATLSKGK